MGQTLCSPQLRNTYGKPRHSSQSEEVDKVLHAERAISQDVKVTYEAMLVELPIGSMFEHESAAYLVVTLGYLPWSFYGYGALHQFDPRAVVKVLTPRSVVRAFAEGFRPRVHPSVTSASPL